MPRQKNFKFKACSGCRVSSRPAWANYGALSWTEKKKKKVGKNLGNVLEDSLPSMSKIQSLNPGMVMGSEVGVAFSLTSYLFLPKKKFPPAQHSFVWSIKVFPSEISPTFHFLSKRRAGPPSSALSWFRLALAILMNAAHSSAALGTSFSESREFVSGLWAQRLRRSSVSWERTLEVSHFFFVLV